MSAIAGDDYLGFCEGLRQISGVDLLQYKRPQMERRLRSFFALKGITKLTESLPRLRADKTELEALLDRMTINVSQLWRNPQHWEKLEREILPELGRSGKLEAWSAGCSYGAEAFTLAAMCHEVIPRARVRILGTDIDRRIVARATCAEFAEADARSAPPAAMERSFERIDGGWRARPALRAMTRFEFGDLLRIKPPVAAFDLVLCRNTVIYFSEPIRDQLHTRLAGAVRPGGYLMIGATERVVSPTALGLTQVHPFIFRKT
jgi:chemotaxis protein methyltransferase CheR